MGKLNVSSRAKFSPQTKNLYLEKIKRYIYLFYNDIHNERT